MSDLIVCERAGDVVTLRLNNPAAMNAMDGDMADEMTARLVEAGQQARAVVLAGGTRAFCAGANLTSPQMDGGGEFDAGARLESSFNPMMMAVRECPVPVVSAVCGAAAGIGASLALAADMIVAGRSAYFLQAFRRVGLVPDGGSAFLLAHAVGRVRAMELMLLGERLPAETALAWGLINRVEEDEAVESAAAALAAELAAGPTQALGMLRASAWAALTSEWETQLERERAFQRRAGQSEDFAEGVAAFREKRPAVFSGR